MHEVASTDYGAPWDVITRTVGRAIGRDDLAADQIDSVRNRFAAVAARHPLWLGQSGVEAYHWAGTTGVVLPGDARPDFLAEPGFAVPSEVADLAGGGYFIDLSPEDLQPLDAGALVWIKALEADPDLAALPMRHTLVAWEQGREVFAGPLASAAMAHGSVQSMPLFALDLLTADLTAAAYGLAETPVPSAVSAGLAP